MIDVNIMPKAVDALLAAGLTPGKIITHFELEKILHLDRNAKDYPFKKLSRVQELRERILVEYKIDLKNIRGQGYMVVAPEEQTRLAIDDTIRGIGLAISKGYNRVVNTDVAKLTDESRKENTDAIARLAGLGSMTKKQIES